MQIANFVRSDAHDTRGSVGMSFKRRSRAQRAQECATARPDLSGEKGSIRAAQIDSRRRSAFTGPAPPPADSEDRAAVFKARAIAFKDRATVFEARDVVFKARAVVFEARDVVFKARDVVFKARAVVFE